MPRAAECLTHSLSDTLLRPCVRAVHVRGTIRCHAESRRIHLLAPCVPVHYGASVPNSPAPPNTRMLTKRCIQNVARTGSEGVYSALGNAPLFATNLVAGTMSGYLLEAFVPEQGVKRPQFLWGTVGALCVTSPLLMALFRRHVEERNDDYEVVLYEDDSDDELALSLANTQPRSTALLV